MSGGFEGREPPVLRGFGRSPGESRHLVDLKPSEASQVGILLDNGFGFFVESAVGVADMAREAACAALAAADLAPECVDSLLITTESFWDAPETAASPHLEVRDGLLHALICELGLSNARPFGAWMSACSNLGSELALVSGLFAAGRAEHCLLVAADRVRPGVSRLRSGLATVVSDVACAAVVSRGGHGLALKDLAIRTSQGIVSARLDGNYLKLTLEVARGLAELDQDVLQCCGRRLREFDVVLFENLDPILVEHCREHLRIRPEAAARPTRRSLGHAFSADLLLSLGELQAAAPLPPGASVAAISMSSSTLAALLFEVR